MCYAVILLCCWKLYSDFRFTERMQCIYHSIASQYLQDEQGIAYYDLTNADVTFIGGYPMNTYTPHVIKSIGRYLNSRYNLDKAIQVYPSCCKNLQQDGYDNHVINIDKDTHQIIISKANIPMAVKQYREIVIGPIRYPFPPLTIRLFEYPVYENDYYKVFTINDKFPFISGSHVEFIFSNK